VDEDAFSTFVATFVESWPDFICRGDVTFGFFKVRRRIEENRDGQRGTFSRPTTISCIQPRFIPITLLKFGELSATRTVTVRTRRGDEEMIRCDIPIMGGLLALSSRWPKSSSSNDPYRGALSFGVRTVSKPCLGGNKYHIDCCDFTTQIVDYRPSLVGYPPLQRKEQSLVRPSWFPLRKWIYLHSQSYAHAYITWRFHRSFWESERNRHQLN
jgi:hypothetical protein